MDLAEEITNFVEEYGNTPYLHQDLLDYYKVMLMWGNVLVIRNGKKITLVSDYYLNSNLTKMLVGNNTKAFGQYLLIKNAVLFPKYRGNGLKLLLKCLKMLIAKHPEVKYVGWKNRKKDKISFFTRRAIWETKGLQLPLLHPQI